MKTIFITGATDGIGKATALHLAKEGNKMILHGRNPDRLKDTTEWIKTESNNKNIEYAVADFSSLASVKKMVNDTVNRLDHIDILINNAGIITPEYTETNDGFETIFQVNHLAVFLLTLGLLPLIKNKKNSQIVNVASISHSYSLDFDKILDKKYFNPFDAYEISKLANILFTYKLARDLKNENVLVNTLHPGVIRTKLLHVLWGGGDDVSEAVKVIKNVIFQAKNKHLTGQYFVGNLPSKSAPISYNHDIQTKMWNYCKRLIKKGYLK